MNQIGTFTIGPLAKGHLRSDGQTHRCSINCELMPGMKGRLSEECRLCNSHQGRARHLEVASLQSLPTTSYVFGRSSNAFPASLHERMISHIWLDSSGWSLRRLRSWARNMGCDWKLTIYPCQMNHFCDEQYKINLLIKLRGPFSKGVFEIRYINSWHKWSFESQRARVQSGSRPLDLVSDTFMHTFATSAA